LEEAGHVPSFGDLLLRTVDGIFAVDARQRIVLWNPGCEQLFGLPVQQALGRSCSEIVRGKNPMEQPVCGGGCCIASFAENPNIPSVFPLRARDAAGRELRLTVSVLLVPSMRKEQRLCVHLLRCGAMMDPVLESQNGEHSTRPQQARAPAQDEMPPSVSGLTTREREILKLLAEGLGVGVISQLMKISIATVRNHVQHIEGKLAVHSQAEAVAYAYRHNLV
jgi:DNA-binding CsgD family transcriptional regulator